jgi:ribosomal protein S6--L-glutamate ligase
MPPRLSHPFILGWEEWVMLPELGLGAIKAKVDTGARTSALHAFYAEPFGPARARKVRFGVHPLPRRSDIAVECTARLIDRREVKSSNGEIEERYVIETPIRIGERQWRIEVTLANRDMMTYRMLLGRQAIPRDGLVKPSASFLQPKLHYSVYDRPR